jgi:hypothetical protein
MTGDYDYNTLAQIVQNQFYEIWAKEWYSDKLSYHNPWKLLDTEPYRTPNFLISNEPPYIEEI